MNIKSILLYIFIAHIYTDMSEEVTVHWSLWMEFSAMLLWKSQNLLHISCHI